MLRDVVREKYRFVEEKSVLEKEILREILYVYHHLGKAKWFQKKELKISLIENIKIWFPRTKRIKVKEKLYPLYFDNAKVFNSFI